MILISIQVPKGTEGTYFETFLFSVFSPIQHGVVSIYKSVGKFWDDYFYLREVKSQNKKLLTEVTQLRQENTILRNRLKKYEEEKEIKGFLTNISENLVNAWIIGFDMSNLYKSVVINKGSRQGVKRNRVVLDESGNLVGRIVDPISSHQATVQLITDNKSGVSVVKQEGSSVGILSGDNNGMCEMKYILSTDEDIDTGDTLVTTGHDGIFPPYLKVGTVISVKKTPEMFREIKVNPYFRLGQLHQVVVLNVDTKEKF
ncbi:MAG: rod shape-determining protein MreC [Acidobacteriota bacterium]